MERIELLSGFVATPSLGAEETFNTFYAQYASRIRAELHHWTRSFSPEDKEDIEQEIWKAVWRGLPRFKRRCTPTTWLISVARHVIFSWLRSKQCRDAGQRRIEERCAFSDSNEFCNEINPMLEHLSMLEDLANVESRYAVVLRLRYFEQLTDTDVARRLELPLGTVKGRIRVGLRQLRCALGRTTHKS